MHCLSVQQQLPTVPTFSGVLERDELVVLLLQGALLHGHLCHVLAVILRESLEGRGCVAEPVLRVVCRRVRGHVVLDAGRTQKAARVRNGC